MIPSFCQLGMRRRLSLLLGVSFSLLVQVDQLNCHLEVDQFACSLYGLDGDVIESSPLTQFLLPLRRRQGWRW